MKCVELRSEEIHRHCAHNWWNVGCLGISFCISLYAINLCMCSIACLDLY